MFLSTSRQCFGVIHALKAGSLTKNDSDCVNLYPHMLSDLNHFINLYSQTSTDRLDSVNWYTNNAFGLLTFTFLTFNNFE